MLQPIKHLSKECFFMSPDELLPGEINIAPAKNLEDASAIRVILRNNSLKAVKYADIDAFSEAKASVRASFRDIPSGGRAEQTVKLQGSFSRYESKVVLENGTILGLLDDDLQVAFDETAVTLDITIGGPVRGAPIPQNTGNLECLQFGYIRNPNRVACTFEIKETWWQEGPNCNTIGESQSVFHTLQAYEERNVGCAYWTSVNSWCIERKKWECLRVVATSVG
jgi:hypothetical protein